MSLATDSTTMAAAFGSKDVAELAALYAGWAETYDAENAAGGFRMPQICSAFLARYVPARTAPVLDAGCGTGLVGDCLRVLGYPHIVGIDVSEPMLERAARLGIYDSLHRMVLGEHLEFPDRYFAAVISSGVFTEGHAPSTSFDELIRVTRPGGHLVFSVRDDIYEEHGFRERQDSLEAEGRWKLRERSDRFRPYTLKEPRIISRVFVYATS